MGDILKKNLFFLTDCDTFDDLRNWFFADLSVPRVEHPHTFKAKIMHLEWICGYLGIPLATNVASEEILLEATIPQYMLADKPSILRLFFFKNSFNIVFSSK